MALQAEMGYMKQQIASKVYVILAPRENPDLQSFLSLEEALRTANMSGIQTILTPILRGVPGFHNANGGLALALKSDCTHVFFAADDVLYPAHIIVKLIENNKDVVGGIYRKRDLANIVPANSVPSVEEFQRRFQEKGVYPTEYASGHTMMIKRTVIEKMIADYPELEYVNPHTNEIEWGLWWPMIKDRMPLMDDWSFSVRAKASGFTLWDDYSLICRHLVSEFVGFPEGATVFQPVNTASIKTVEGAEIEEKVGNAQK